jgi:hypothetical protein
VYAITLALPGSWSTQNRASGFKRLPHLETSLPLSVWSERGMYSSQEAQERR